MDKKKYLYENINDIDINSRRELLQLIFNFSSSIIKEKGCGVQIKFDDIPESLIDNLYNIVYKKIQDNILDINF